MTYTVAQLENLISNVGDDEYFSWSEVRYGGYEFEDGTKLEHVDSHGGEGEGDEAWVVFRVGDQLFMKTGYYTSHYGFEWDGDLEEVEAYEKTVTDYRPVR